MKPNPTKQILAVALFYACLSQQAIAVPTTIVDTYWGGNSHGDTNDVIGSVSVFGIDSMDVERIGNTLKVSINTGFAGRGDDGLYDGTNQTDLTYGKGIGYGDLFINDTWNPAPAGSGPEYKTDDNTNGTIWSYGFSLDDRWMNEANPGTGSLYELNSGNNNADTFLSDDFLSGGTFRNGQEVAVDKTSAGVNAVSNNNSSWDISTGKVNFVIDLSGTNLINSNTFALHWAMTCGNDTIEGLYTQTPEPAILGLLGLGLLGMGFTRKKA